MVGHQLDRKLPHINWQMGDNNPLCAESANLGEAMLSTWTIDYWSLTYHEDLMAANNFTAEGARCHEWGSKPLIYLQGRLTLFVSLYKVFVEV